MPYSYDDPLIFRIRVPQPGDPAPKRPHPKEAHPPETVALVRRLIETTTTTHRLIAFQAGVDKGTVSRWQAQHGWTRPPGACKPAPRDATRYRPNVIGRALATRLRIQAERLVCEIEAAERVHPEALAEALRLLAQARAEQNVRRGRKRLPPPPEEVAAALAAKEAARQEVRDRARFEEAHFRRTRYKLPPLPSPHLPPRPGEPPRYRWRWDRAEAARMGWRRRYERMRGEQEGVIKKKG